MNINSKYKNGGYTGLTNLGNTCFLNSCMQVLNHTYELHALLDSNKMTKPDIPDHIIIEEWNNLRDVMWKQNGTVSPNRFVHQVQKLAEIKGRDLFTGWAQNDLPEFLLFMIDCMHNSMARPVTMKILGTPENNLDQLAIECYKMLQDVYSREYSECMNLFYGIYVSEILSEDTNLRHSIKPEPFFILDLEIPKPNATLYECLDAFTRSEHLSGDNAWLNEKTGERENVMKRITFWNFPDILIITLKRFSANGMYKRQDLIDFPLENLDLSKYVTGYNAKQYVYDLYGVCNHYGGPMGGHYTAYVKNTALEWIHFNDSHLDKNTKQVVSPLAYCLFYRKKK